MTLPLLPGGPTITILVATTINLETLTAERVDFQISLWQKSPRSRTFWALELLDEMLDGVLRPVNDQRSHHFLERLVQFLLLNVLLTGPLVLELFLLQHHFMKLLLLKFKLIIKPTINILSFNGNGRGYHPQKDIGQYPDFGINHVCTTN